MLKNLSKNNIFHDWLTPKRELYCQSLVLMIIAIANIRIYWLNVLVQDDYYYGIYRWRELTAFPKITEETYGFLNRSLCWVAGNSNVYFARSLVLFCVIFPTALLLYSILRKLNYPILVVFFTVVMVWIFPGQTEIPLFVNGSYTAEAMLVMLLSFWGGLKFLENGADYRWGWFGAALLAQFWALNISELVVPSSAALIFCYLCWGKFAGKSWLLSAAISVQVLYHVYFNILHGGRGIITQAHPLTFRSLGNVVLVFIDWCLPPTFISYFDDNIWRKWIVVAVIFLLTGYVLGKKLIGDKGSANRVVRSIWRDEFIWRAVFPLLIFLLPLIVMAIAPWFMPRHAIFPAVGFYLYLSFTINELLIKRQNLLVFIVAVIVISTVIKHYSWIDRAYLKSNRDHEEFVAFAPSRYFPARSQIVVTNMDVATSGYGYWSSGYLEYVLKRKDLSGLIGKEMNMIDPFKAHEYSVGGMNGLNTTDPLFLFRKIDGAFHQLTYLLQWRGNNLDSAYVLYKVDPSTGKIAQILEGVGLESYAENCVALATGGLNRADILGGGILTPLDMKRLSAPRK